MLLLRCNYHHLCYIFFTTILTILSSLSTSNGLSHSSSPSSSLKESKLQTPSLLPCVGYASTATGASNNRNIHYIVIGTSHFTCKSSQEVSTLIQSIQPDGVVVELDPERVIRLTKQSSYSSSSQQTEEDKKLLFGQDFVSAITTSIENDIPLFVGDEYTKETKQRLWNTLFDVETYGSRRLWRTLFPKHKRRRNNNNMMMNETVPITIMPFVSSTEIIPSIQTPSAEPIDLMGTFLSDPMKLAPLAVTLTPPALIVFVTMMFHHWQQQLSSSTSSDVVDIITTNDYGGGGSISISSSINIVTTIASIVVSFFTTCKVFNTIIADRDDILVVNAKRAARVVEGLKNGETIRKRWTFGVDESYTRQHKDDTTTTTTTITSDENETQNNENGNINKAVPLFTLKTPMKTNDIRNLNLFEPRWLKMIDSLAYSSPIQDSSNNDVPQQQQQQQQQRFGCVTCTNKFYSAISLPSSSTSEEGKHKTKEGRYADVIFHRKGIYANILKMEEGKRIVSGDRKVRVMIEGDEEFWIEQKNDNGEDGGGGLGVSKEGYIVAEEHMLKRLNEGMDHTDRSDDVGYENNKSSVVDENEEDIKIVVVVGLLHANGIIDQLSKDSGAAATIRSVSNITT